MEAVKQYWITGLAVVLGIFLLFLAFAFAGGQSQSAGRQVIGVLVTGVPGIALLGGLWGLRSGRVPVSICMGAIVLGLAGAMSWWWLFLPTIAAVVVFWFGVIRGGLARELGIT